MINTREELLSVHLCGQPPLSPREYDIEQLGGGWNRRNVFPRQLHFDVFAGELE